MRITKMAQMNHYAIAVTKTIAVMIILRIITTNPNQYFIGAENDSSVVSLKLIAVVNVTVRYDYIYIYDGNDNFIGEYTGSALANESVIVQGDTVKIRLKTDRSNTYYGFKITDICAEKVTNLSIPKI